MTSSVFAAIIGYARFSEDPINFEVAVFLLLLVCLVSIFGVYHLIDMHLVLTKYRKKIFNIARKYKFIRQIDLVNDDEGFFKYFFGITVMFIVLVLGGLGLVFLSFYKSGGNNFSGFSIAYSYCLIFFADITFAGVFTCRAAKEARKFDRDLDNVNNVEGENDLTKE